MGSWQGPGLLTLAYVDASAAVKLFRAEAGSAEMRAELRQWSARASSEILAVELRCVARRDAGSQELSAVEDVLTRVELLPWEPVVAHRAGTTPFAPALRALDAIHLATALSVSEDLGVLLAYDRDLLAAAVAHGLPVASPGQP